MSEQQLSSTNIKQSSRLWKRWIISIFGIYMIFCFGTGLYMRSAIEKICTHPRIKPMVQSTRLKFFPIPVFTVYFNPLADQTIQLPGVVALSPNWRGLLSGQYIKYHSTIALNNSNIKGNAVLCGFLNPLEVTFNSLEEFILFWGKATSLEAKMDIQFQDYIGTVDIQNTGTMCNKWSYTMRKKNDMISIGHVIQQWKEKSTSEFGSVEQLDMKGKFECASNFFLILSKAASQIGLSSSYLNWLGVNVSHLTQLLLPFSVEGSAYGVFEKKGINKCFASLRDLIKNRHEKTLSLQHKRVQEFLKTLARVAFKHEMKWKLLLSEQAKAECNINLSQKLAADGMSELHAHLDLDWDSLLSYFEQKTPESYKNVYKLLNFIVSMINKGQKGVNLKTDIRVKYHHDGREIEEFTINDMSFRQLLQAFFSNPEMLKYLNTK